MDRLKDKVCIVTGGARGLGLAIAERFSAEAAKMVYAVDVEASAFTEISQAKPNLRCAVLNVTDPVAIKAFVQRVLSESGTIDVLVNNAGITRDALIQKMSDADWASVIAVNLTGVFNMTREVAPVMMGQGAGAVISIASVVGLDGNIGQSNYAATKGGVVAMTKGWAKEFARKGAKVRVNAVSPGYARTPMIASVPEKVLEPIIARTPLGRLAEPSDIASAALFLASDEACFITGQVLRVDGGLVL